MSKIDLKFCNKCKETKTKTDFRYRTDRNYLVSYCRSCERLYNKKRNKKLYEEDPEKYIETTRRKARENYWKNPERSRFLRKVYLLQNVTNKAFSFEEIESWYNLQEKICSICRIIKCPTGRDLSIDHNHKFKKLRGLLCINCNQGLGKFKDNPYFLDQANSYLMKNENDFDWSIFI